MRKPRFAAVCLVLAAYSLQADAPWESLKYRLVGPYRGGRVTTVAGVNSQPQTYYFGATGGGVFKTTNAGRTWLPVSDGFFKTGSVGAIAVAESNPNIIFAGMGESPVRGNVSHGDGVYRSGDGGKTWKHVGLAETRHIARVRVHPANPDLIYVAALGHLFASHEARGVFRSRDGGKSWQKVLFRNADAGAIDLAMDPVNPDVLYAGFWQVRRTPWSLESGGPGSAIYKSVDGGDNWTEITKNRGLPEGILGKVGITVSPVNNDRVWAIIEAEQGGVFRSDDAGRTWTRVNENRNLRQRAWYYTRIYADTQEVNRVYVLNVGFWRSDDGGATFKSIPTPHGDNHDLWIDPRNNQRMIEGNDGGANVSGDGGETWTDQKQPTAQFYRVTVDGDFPYNIYGAQQDNSTIRIASRTVDAGIDERHWWDVGGGESGWIAPHPKDSHIVFAGSYGGYLTRYDHRTGQTRAINVWPDNPMGYGAEGMKYRFQWNFPILFSPHDAGVLYTAGNMVFQTRNEGQNWQAISPDLTRNDRSKMGPSGGPITKDNTSVEYYGTVFALAESPLARGVLWAGSDDGLIHLTRDGGKRWENVTPPKAMMPEWIQINSIDASPHDPATAWVAATMYKHDDFRPYLYVTTDYGKTWKKIVNGIAPEAFTRVVREDPAARGLLYAGTETGMYVSFDSGAAWEPLQLNLPVVPITDLVLHKGMNDLVVATQGRSFYVLDDLTVLQNWQKSRATIEQAAAHFFDVEPAYRMPGGSFVPRPGSPIGQNPPAGAVFHYWLKEKAKEARLEIRDAAGKEVKKMSSKPPAREEDEAGAGRRADLPGPASVPAEKGLNRFVWDLRHEDASRFPGMILWAGGVRGPVAAPGRYSARFVIDGKESVIPFEVRKDPRIATTQEEFEKQLAALLQIRDKLTETHDAIARIRDVRQQVNATAARYSDLPAGKQIGAAAKELARKLTAVEEELYQTKLRSGQDPLNYPIKLNNKLAALGGIIASADAAPTDQSYQLQEELTGRINAQLRVLSDVMSRDLDSFNRLVRESNVPVVAPARKQEGAQ